MATRRSSACPRPTGRPGTAPIVRTAGSWPSKASRSSAGSPLSPYSGRQVYAGVAWLSVYVATDAQGRGIGGGLLGALIEASEAAGIWTLLAGILVENAASLAAHRAAGFRRVGVQERLGRDRTGRWRDVVLMERRSTTQGIGDGGGDRALGWHQEATGMFYVSAGNVPHKRHTQHRAPDGELYAEELFGVEGFVGRSSLLYHLVPPTQTHRIEAATALAIEEADDGVHRHRLVKTGGLTARGDALSAAGSRCSSTPT